MKKVVKFGGSSLASARQFKKVKAIIDADKARSYVVPSAPGKRDGKDTKVTDLLYQCYEACAAGQSYKRILDQIKKRFDDIINGLDLDLNLDFEFDTIEENFKNKAGRAYAASRGEYLNGIIMKQAVIPGFYGSKPDGSIATFSRGGSDVTGSLVARALHADLYENWTDVSGFLVADPRIVEDPAPIETITYRELRELSYMGANVLHEDAIFPVRKEGIPINIKNTNRPSDPGTMIVESTSKKPSYTITGVAGKKGFCSIVIDKAMMNSEIGFGRKVLEVLEKNNISFEHLPSGIDTMTVYVHQSEFQEREQAIISGIHRAVHPDSIDLESDLALIAIVGRGMRSNLGVAARIFAALSHARINVKMIDQGSREMNVIIGIRDEDFENAIRAIYDVFVKTAL